MWTYVLGPFLALLPKWWRKWVPFLDPPRWRRATILSGFAEFVGAIVALSYWYMFAMSTWVDRGVDAAMTGKLGPGITTHQIAGVALSVWAMHPVTWVLGYLVFEGAVRLCSAAFADSVFGTLPLFVTDKVLFGMFRSGSRGGSDAKEGFAGNISSYFSAIRERMAAVGVREVPDELFFQTNGASEEILEIRASRKKPDWNPPRVVRFEDRYYRLEKFSVGGGARPFRYMLRRLAAGVPGRTVLPYSGDDAVTRS
jgi:hypothetical protein